uniref:S-adenosyl-L-methionine:O-methyltransferase n=1 Tax=Papaver somniferum TaxID=3469 RepID=A0A0H4IQC1_PAPSO|nr:S-adenosyl-L-methionine:O-methyltransferase [Papaver somniferum]
MVKVDDRREDEEERLRGQAEIWDVMLAFVDSMALKCAVELGIPDIINSHGRAITLLEITNAIKTNSQLSSSPDINCLSRIMRLLVRKRVFSSQSHPEAGETDETMLYNLTPSSKWLLRDSEFSLVPMVLFEHNPRLMAPWHYLTKCVQEGGFAFEKTYGTQVWDYALANPDINKLLNDAMECTARIIVVTLLAAYKEGFDGIETIVDVGGGTGMVVIEIVKAHPHMRGVNFDLPHVVAAAPEFEGVKHVGGDFFVNVPHADAVIMKWVLHDWCDEDAVRILKNCRKAIPKDTGKVIIVDFVLKPDGKELFDHMGLVFDMLMMAHSSNGKERTEVEWKKLLNDAGFPTYKVIKIPTLGSIIEAYPY